MAKTTKIEKETLDEKSQNVSNVISKLGEKNGTEK